MSDKDKILDEIFENDPLNILKINAKSNTQITSDQRLENSFIEINNFIKKNNREPRPDPSNISEYKLYSILKGLRDNDDKILKLKEIDELNLFKDKAKEINSIDDIFDDDSLGVLDDETNIFNFKHTPKNFDRAKADFIGKRVKCHNFDDYKDQFKEVQDDLSYGRRKLIDFKLSTLREGNYYVHNGLLFYLESIQFDREDHYKEDGTRVRKDGRTRCIFENGTESNILMRSVEKNLYKNGKSVTHNSKNVVDEYSEKFHEITDEDNETGFIYVVKSLSENKEISSIENLYKIGFSLNSVEERVKNAKNETSYLMAPVKIISTWKCYNMNVNKFENLIQKFFKDACLSIDINDKNGNKHSPREWFILPFEIIEDAIDLIINGEILKYKFNINEQSIERK